MARTVALKTAPKEPSPVQSFGLQGILLGLIGKHNSRDITSGQMRLHRIRGLQFWPTSFGSLGGSCLLSVSGPETRIWDPKGLEFGLGLYDLGLVSDLQGFNRKKSNVPVGFGRAPFALTAQA